MTFRTKKIRISQLEMKLYFFYVYHVYLFLQAKQCFGPFTGPMVMVDSAFISKKSFALQLLIFWTKDDYLFIWVCINIHSIANHGCLRKWFRTYSHTVLISLGGHEFDWNISYFTLRLLRSLRLIQICLIGNMQNLCCI